MDIQDFQYKKEGQTFDCKSIQIEPKSMAIPLVAMANADGGILAIGISDKTRRIEGVDQHAGRLNELLRVPYDYCKPTIKVRAEYVSCIDSEGKDNHVLLLHVPASSQLHTNQQDEAYMRVGDKSKKLGFDERLQLLYDKGERSYEDEPTYNATIDDINLNAVEEYVKLIGYEKSVIEYLNENNDFIKEKDGNTKVSHACILLFGKKPQHFFPRARTRFIRYEGLEEKVGTEMNVVKDVTFEGTILQQIKQTISYIETQVKEHSFLGQDGLFVTNHEYPKFVIQEMVVNSCCHRDYSIKGTEIQIKMFDNRIVFETPGNFPGLVRADNIRHTHFSRNPKIAQFLKAYKYVKEFGEGIDRIFRELAMNNIEMPKFKINGFILSVSIPHNEKLTENSSVVAERLTEKLTENGERLIEKLTEKFIINGDKLTENRKRILLLMLSNPYVSKEELSKAVGISKTAISDNIEVMRGKYIRRVGPDKGGFWEVMK